MPFKFVVVSRLEYFLVVSPRTGVQDSVISEQIPAHMSVNCNDP